MKGAGIRADLKFSRSEQLSNPKQPNSAFQYFPKGGGTGCSLNTLKDAKRDWGFHLIRISDNQ